MDAGVIVAIVATAIAAGSLAVAIRSNQRADEANRSASDANQLAEEANATSRRALEIEENRDRAQTRPKVRVELGGEADGHFGTAALLISHDGTANIDEVVLRVADPTQVVFFPGDEAFIAQGGKPGPQHETLHLAPLAAGIPERRAVLWRNYENKKATIISENRIGDDKWSDRHDIELSDDARFDR